MSTGLGPTDLSTAQVASASSGQSAGKKSRRKTSHLKEVPQSLAMRESLRDRCAEVASRLPRDVPMTKDEMERIARRTLAEADLPEGYLGWMMVMISSAFWQESLKAVPPERRLFLLPHCLKHAEGCPAEYDQFGMNCKECGACSIADFRGLAEDMGYRVLVAEGSPSRAENHCWWIRRCGGRRGLLERLGKKQSTKFCWREFRAWRYRFLVATVAIQRSTSLGSSR